MSKTNYRKCVSLGVTGRQTNTCFPASIDKVISHLRIPSEYYMHYENPMNIYDSLSERQKNPSMNSIYKDLINCSGIQDLLFRRIETIEALRDLARLAFKDDLAIIVDTPIGKDVHSLGVEAINRKLGHYILQSTHVPHQLRGVVTLEKIFEHLSKPKESPRKRYTFNDANITLIAS